MSPVRKKILKIFLPIWFAFSLLPLIPLCILMGIDEERYLPYVVIWAVVVLFVGLIWLACFLPWINKKEKLLAVWDNYGYLTQDSFAEAEEFETKDDETGIVYTVQRDGLKIVFPLPEGYVQVFDEAPDNVEFLPWERTRMALASSNERLTVKMAVAVLDVSTAQMDEDGATSYEEPFFIPLSEQLVRAIKSFGLEEKMDGGWEYLLYNPQDAIAQIYRRGYVRVLRDRQTGKRLSEQEWEDLRK